jgi:3,4-dihydroxy-9,10-secoandrosta-1,3,5(10)-triene-9,17-dione 4,5-dioxygenase
MSVTNLAYIHISETDKGSWAQFGGAILGLMPIERAGFGDNSFLKMDDAPFRVMVSVADEGKLLATGWDTGSQAGFDAMAAKLEAAGITVTAGDSNGAALRCVEQYASAKDPAGNPFEIFHTRTSCADCDVPFVSPTGVKKFVTGDMGLGHAVIPAPNIDETHAFYTDVMGFGNSDDLRLAPPAEGAPELRIVFMHASNARHHSLALANFPHPVGIVHMMVEVTSIDEVGECLDRVSQAGIPLLSTLGRHCNDNMVSFYAIGPGGIAVEFGYDGLQVDDWSKFTATQSTEGDFWGHAYQAMPS